MPPRSFVLDLPDDLRAALNARLVAQGFADYSGFANWINQALEERGLVLRVSRSAIHRHGQQFEEKLEVMRIATEQAKAIAAGASDDAGAMNEALIRLVQTKMFEALMNVEQEEDLGKIGVAIAHLSRASVTQKKWADEVRAKLEAQKQAAAAKVEAIAKTRGLTADVAALIRAEILGIKIESLPRERSDG